MGLFGLGRMLRSPGAECQEVLERYQRLRGIRFRLNNQLVRRLTRDVLQEGATKLGIFRRGVIVFETEDESSVLMDYCIYNVIRSGRNAVEQYLCECPPDPDSEEMATLRAMQHATYGLILVQRVEPGVGCHVRNLLTDETRLLADLGFAKSAVPGALIATRLMDLGDFWTTGGAALPLGVLDDEAIEPWQQKLRAGVHDNHYDPAAIIRAALQMGASLRIQYEGTPNDSRSPAAINSGAKKIFPRRPDPIRIAGKPGGNQRCRCGSGKMFKNCCGKNARTGR